MKVYIGGALIAELSLKSSVYSYFQTNCSIKDVDLIPNEEIINNTKIGTNLTAIVSSICEIERQNQQKIKIDLSTFTVFNFTAMRQIEQCDPKKLNVTIIPNVGTFSEESDKLCSDAFSIIYLNIPSTYQQLKSYCRKISGTLITEGDLITYARELQHIINVTVSHEIVTWLESLDGRQDDFTAWCLVLLLGGSMDTRPCGKSLPNNICKVNTTTTLRLFGKVLSYDRNFTLMINDDGAFFLKGVGSSVVRKFGNVWTLQSNLHEEMCSLQNNQIPFVRQIWTCGSESVNLTLTTCRPGEFACTTGTCLSQNVRCDGIVNCDDKSDEEQCKNIDKDPGYSTLIGPPPLLGEEYRNMQFILHIFSISDIETANFYAEVDFKIILFWRDSRFTVWNNLEGIVDCNEIWSPTFEAQDTFPHGQYVPIPENFVHECRIDPAMDVEVKTPVEDPFMGMHSFIYVLFITMNFFEKNGALNIIQL